MTVHSWKDAEIMLNGIKIKPMQMPKPRTLADLKPGAMVCEDASLPEDGYIIFSHALHLAPNLFARFMRTGALTLLGRVHSVECTLTLHL